MGGGMMTDQISDEIMDKLKKVCICKGISKAAIKKAILDGALSVEEVEKITGAGSGGCQGRRCRPKIQEML
jgi:bacterioferritin-associated ferredoxin